MELPYNQEDIVAKIEKVAQSVRAQFDAFVVLGIGGSALGPIAVQQALNHQRWNDLPSEKRNGPRFYVEDNVDPERMASLLDVIDVKRTCFNVITKSGATAETMSQYLIVSELLKKEVGEGWQKHIIATTDREKGNLIKLARRKASRRSLFRTAWAAASASCLRWGFCPPRCAASTSARCWRARPRWTSAAKPAMCGRIPRCWKPRGRTSPWKTGTRPCRS
jgi:hypothetical protein